MYNPKALVALKGAPGCSPQDHRKFVILLNQCFGSYDIHVSNGVRAADGRYLAPGQYAEFLASGGMSLKAEKGVGSFVPSLKPVGVPAEPVKPKVVEKPPVEVVSSAKMKYDYEEIGKGKKKTFKCLHCDKPYKTETGVLKHVDMKHR